MKRYALIDGILAGEEATKVSIFERGYLYGDGIFDTMRSYKGKIFRFEDHFERLNKNACALGINPALGDRELNALILKLLKKNKLKDAYIRVAISRGKAGLGPKPVKRIKPHLTVIVRPSKHYPADFYEKGVEVRISPVRRFSPSALDGKIKSMNYLNSILARGGAAGEDVFETLLLSEDGYITEGSFSNIFIVREDKLITPPSHLGVLEGITRKVVLEIAERLGIDTETVPFNSYDIYTAGESFLTSTGIEVMPVRMLDKRIIGKGIPGKITQIIGEEFIKERSKK
jgi:branched-chain amino acid aminotransferase